MANEKNAGEATRKTPEIRVEENMPVRNLMYISHYGEGDPGRVFDVLTRHVKAKMGFEPRNQAIVSYANPACLAAPQRATWRLDCGVEVDVNEALRSNALMDDFSLRQIQGGRYALYTHVGPYENIAVTMNKLLLEWIPAAGLKLRSDPCPIVEVYIDEPTEVPAEKRRTEIQVPLA